MINGIKSFFKGRPAASGEEQTLSGEQQGSRSDWDEVEVDFQVRRTNQSVQQPMP